MMSTLEAIRHRPEASSIEDAEILRLKSQTGQTIAVVLPTLNEEKTIGKITNLLLEVQREGVIDELVVVDSGSTDNTVKICNDLGITTYDSSETLPQIGIEKNIRGKGVNLYLGQFLTDSSIIVYLDSDQYNFDPRIVNNLVYPLLTDPKVMIVKSFFQRRSFDNLGQQISSGGRVTMLTVKPFLDIFFPKLSDILQPINGNVAIRRSATETVSFLSQYEADLQLLLETFWGYDRESIAQVFCGTFEQNGQDMVRLQRMAFQLMQYLFNFLVEKGIITITQPLNPYLRQYDNEFLTYEYTSLRLPPALAFPDYERKFRTKITVLPNAYTDNIQRRIQKQTDIPIEEQALNEYLQKLRNLPKPELIVTSDLPSSQQTAEAIRSYFDWFNIPVISDPRFNEIMEGAIDYRPPNGESIAEVRERVWRGLTDLRRLYPGNKILLITHAGVMLSLNLNPNNPNNLIVSRKEDGNYFINNM